MRAWLLDELAGLEALRLAEVAEPTAPKDEVLLEVRYAALNPADRYLAERLYPAKPSLPHVLGRDGLGTVTSVGEGVSSVTSGDRRVLLRGEAGVNRWGTFAQRVAVPVESLVEIPDGWNDQESAGATLVYLTAYQALTMWGPLPESAVVLVTGASGGVGVATIQLARAFGYRVLALSRDPEKSRRLREIGASDTYDIREPRWRQAVRADLGARGVDLAIDNIGGRLLPQVIETLGEQGKVSLVGRLAGPVPEFNTAALFFRRIRMGGVAVGAYTNAESRAAWGEVRRLLAQTGARPLVDSVFPFEELPQAFARLAQGPMGKVLLEVHRGQSR
jgi:NADPH2:quinone reductase